MVKSCSTYAKHMVNFPKKLEISEVVAEILMDATD
jgi:hypothetical protein